MIARREHPHPGAQLTYVDADGRRLQVLVTDLSHPDLTDPDPTAATAQQATPQQATWPTSRRCGTDGTAPSAKSTTTRPQDSPRRLGVVRDQHGLGAALDHRARPARTDPAARPRRRPRPLRAQTAALLPAAHRGPHSRNRPAPNVQTRRRLALDPAPAHRVRPRPSHPAAHLNTEPAANRPPQTPPPPPPANPTKAPNRGLPRPDTPQTASPAQPKPRNPAQDRHNPQLNNLG